MLPTTRLTGATQCIFRALGRRTRAPLLAALFLAAAQPALADDPPAPEAPAYRSVEEARAAADAASRESDRIKQRYADDERACMDAFFATACADRARVRRNEDLTRADYQRRQAELYIRREEARARHEKLDADNARRDERAAEKAAERSQDAPAAPRQPAQPTPRAPAEPPAPREVDDPAVRAQNRAEYERKQQEAREYAEQQARKRADAEARRAARRAQREADAARLRSESKGAVPGPDATP